MTIDVNGNVGIGTTNPSAQLHVSGKVNNSVVSTSLLPEERLAVFGNYLYGATASPSQTIIHVTNISNPLAPVVVSTTTIAIGSNSYQDYVASLTVSGKYLYVSMQNDLALVFDISIPTSPVYIGNVDSWNNFTNDLALVRGKYFYEAPGYDTGLKIIDVSDPRNPVLIGSTPSFIGNNASVSQLLSGNYVYNVDGGTKLRIIDVSNPANPFVVSTLSGVFNNWGSAKIIDIKGNYVYGVGYGPSRFQIVDVSNPASPTLVYTGSINANAEPRSIVVSGKNAYIGTSNGIQVYDISIPTAPTYLGKVSDTPILSYSNGLYRNDMVVSGRYMYTSVGEVIDLGGAYIQQVETGGVSADDLWVNNDVLFNNNLDVMGGINVGNGGLYSTGALSVSAAGDSNVLSVKVNATTSKTSAFDAAFISNTATSSTNSIIKSGLRISSTGAWSGTGSTNIGLYVSNVTGGTNNFDAIFNGGGNVGIGTSSPIAKLAIRGTAGSGDIFSVASSTNANVFTVAANGNVGVGTANPTNKLQLSVSDSKGFLIDHINQDGHGPTIMLANGTSTYAGHTASIKLNHPNQGGYMVFSLGSIYGNAFHFNNNDGTNLMAIHKGGNVGIGSSTPNAKLYVKGGGTGTGLLTQFTDSANVSRLTVLDNGTTLVNGSDLSIGLTYNDAQLNIMGGSGNYSTINFVKSGSNDGFIRYNNALRTMLFNVAGNFRMTIDSVGNVGIGTTTPADRLQVFGDVRLGTTGTNGCIKDFGGTGITGTCSSDERLKTNIVDLSDGYLDKMNNLKLITYNWNNEANTLNKVDTTVTNYGLLAQNVEAIFPELVSVDSNGYKQVNYSRIPLYLLKAVQELSKKVSGMLDGTMDIFANNLKVKNQFCIDDVCVTKEEFRQMLINSRVNYTAPVINQPVSTPEATSTPEVVVENPPVEEVVDQPVEVVEEVVTEIPTDM